jgi:ABC-type lipoprotein release transport system permease subunit
VLALALTRAVAVLLFNTRPTDPLTFAGVIALLAVVATIASYIPARRAAHIEPVQALRHQ